MSRVELPDDPQVVFIIVGLIAAVAVIALLFASPWLSRVPELPKPVDPPHGEGHAPEEVLDLPAPSDQPPVPSTLVDAPAVPARPVAPWSTGSAAPDPPWPATATDKTPRGE